MKELVGGRKGGENPGREKQIGRWKDKIGGRVRPSPVELEHVGHCRGGKERTWNLELEKV